MRVREYLKFRARLKGLNRKRSRERVDVVMEQCGLTEVSRRIIGQLSKGYRQRVGLADALVHEPELIILDEPTIGLDPHQIRAVRQLIKNLAQSHTVLISTHILPEAEMTCNRMLIMYEGSILAADTPDNLQKLMAGKSQVIAEIAAPLADLRECWARLAEIEQFDVVAGGRRLFSLRADAARRTGPASADFCAGARARLDLARTDTQPAFAGRHLLAGHQTGRGGGRLMQAFWTLTRRELATYFVSVTGYIIIAAATFLIGLSFVVLLRNLGSDPSPMPVTELFYRTYFFWLILLLATPIITMRLFALEKFSGTFETLMTTPVSDLQVVLAKFTAALVFYMAMWLPMFACLFIVQRYANQPGALDAGTVGSTYLGIFLLGALFLSLGCFASALTRSQMVAAMVTLLLGVTLFALGFLAEQIPIAAQWQAQVLGYFALFQQMQDFARGVVDSRSVVVYVSLTLFFLFLTLRAVESRRWK